jgi:hypothetical protein
MKPCLVAGWLPCALRADPEEKASFPVVHGTEDALDVCQSMRRMCGLSFLEVVEYKVKSCIRTSGQPRGPPVGNLWALKLATENIWG